MGIYSRHQVMIQIVLLVAIAVSVNGDQRSQYICDPLLDCQGRKVGDMVPDPYDCQKFYLCISSPSGITPTDDPLSCPSDEFFSHAAGDCKPENGNPCQDICLNMCKTTCETANEVIFYPNDCTKYFICLPNTPEPIEVVCTNGTFFDGTTCTPNMGDCCDNCTPYCDAAYTEVVDPNYCESYYLCTEEGIPPESNHYNCPNGKFFDTLLLKCVTYAIPDIECTPLC